MTVKKCFLTNGVTEGGGEDEGGSREGEGALPWEEHLIKPTVSTNEMALGQTREVINPP